MNPRKPVTRHPARPGARTASLLALLCVILTGCETPATGGVRPLSGEARAEALAADGKPADAAAQYVGLATEASGAERERLTLLAIEQWLIAGDTERAATAYRAIQQPPAASNVTLEHSIRARLLLDRGDAEAAYELLNAISAQPMPTQRRLVVEALRAETFVALDEPARAIEIMRQREAYLSGPDEVRANRELLWSMLAAGSPGSLRGAAQEVMDPEVRGWLTLAALSSATGQQGVGWNNGVIRWQEQHAGHPANDILAQVPEPTALELTYPRQIALLLPLSGQAERAGQAVQNGFLGGYFATAGGLDDRQEVRIYDVNASGGALAAYETAVADGAEFVVGPLLRRNVAELANDSLLPVPVLTLNYLAEGSISPPGLFQFALAPEDEAVAAAHRALAEGHTRAVALAPNSALGRRLLTAFANEFEAGGGTLLDTRSYTAGNPDFSGVIEDLMALTGSVQRYQRLRANIGGPLQFDPRRRQDVEFIFLAADAPTARLMKPQLKFHYSGDLPVYSTSQIYALDGRSDNDLTGIRFADAPWLIDPQDWIARLPDLFAASFPDERRLARLHAMGFDAYQLTGSLYNSLQPGSTLLDGASGELFVDDNGRVHRRLAWAEFRSGVPVALPPIQPLPGEDYGPPGDVDGAGTDDSAIDTTDFSEWNRETETSNLNL